jgi:pimeloyl-ACP methyl ester carboxylesterase
MPSFIQDGIRFNYELIGKGPDIVFTHGLGGDLSQPKDLLGEMSGYRVLLWDVRAHGGTEPVGPDEKLNFPTFAQDLSRLLDAVGIEEAIVGGISMGAAISSAFAVRWPERVRALVLVRPAWVDQPAPANLKYLIPLKRLLDAGGPDAGLHEYRALQEFEPFKGLPPDIIEGLESQLTKPKAYERRARLEQVTQSRPISSWRETEVLTMPALVVGNEPDAAHPMEMAVEWAQRLPHGRLATIPPKTQMDAHRAEFQRHFRQFLAEKGIFS